MPRRIRMPFAHERPRAAGIVTFLVVAAAMLGTGLTSSSSGDLQSQIAAGKSAASALNSQIAADSARIRQTTNGLADANRRLAVLQPPDRSRGPAPRGAGPAARGAQPSGRSREPAAAGDAARSRESGRELRAGAARSGHGDPRGARLHQLVERVNFMRGSPSRTPRSSAGRARPGRRSPGRRACWSRSSTRPDADHPDPGPAQQRRRAPGRPVHQQISELSSRGREATKLHALNGRLASLEKKAAEEAARAAATGNADVGGIAVDTGGMVQAPPARPPRWPR